MSNEFEATVTNVLPEASFALVQLYDALAYDLDSRARKWLLDRFDLISGPREPLALPLQRGDIILRRAEGPHAHACLIADPTPRSSFEISMAGGSVELCAPGSFVFVAERGARPHEEEERFGRRVCDESGRVPKRQMILRPRASAGESEGIDPVSLMVGMTMVSAMSRPREAPRADAAPVAAGGDDAAEDGESSGREYSSADTAPMWPSFSHRGFLADGTASASPANRIAAAGEFNSPEHFKLGLAIQKMVDKWARAGLISGGCLVLDTDAGGLIPIDQWVYQLPDRRHPEDPYAPTPYIDVRLDDYFHWHWILPDSHRDASSNLWTSTSLAKAVQTGKAVTLSIGDIVMMSGDLMGDFADFSAAAASDWRTRPVNIAKGIAAAEPFAMCGARVMQFKRSGTAAVEDIKLLQRATSDYAALKKEVTSSDKIWTAVRALVDFLRKVRGPSGFSELLVLSRLMRKEDISFKTIQNVAPWLTLQDYANVVLPVRNAKLGDFEKAKINSDLFQMIVTNGWYAELALNNEKHFSPLNWRTFEASHAHALGEVERQVPTNQVTFENAPIPAAAVAETAYGLHFLSDAFAAGHMRTPRSILGKAGSLLAGVMHDFDNKRGLIVQSARRGRWRAFGDGYLGSDDGGMDAPLRSNRENAVTAMAAALKQLHYQAQRHFGDTKNAAEFQDALKKTRGTASGLLYDDEVPDSDPGEGVGQRDAWLKTGVNEKIQYLRKLQPRPVADGLQWKNSSTVNHPPLVEMDDKGTVSIDPYRVYSIGQDLMSGRLYELQLIDEDSVATDFTELALAALLTPASSLSWLGSKEVWLPKIFQYVRISRSLTGAALRLASVPSGLP